MPFARKAKEAHGTRVVAEEVALGQLHRLAIAACQLNEFLEAARSRQGRPKDVDIVHDAKDEAVLEAVDELAKRREDATTVQQRAERAALLCAPLVDELVRIMVELGHAPVVPLVVRYQLAKVLEEESADGIAGDGLEGILFVCRD